MIVERQYRGLMVNSPKDEIRHGSGPNDDRLAKVDSRLERADVSSIGCGRQDCCCDAQMAGVKIKPTLHLTAVGEFGRSEWGASCEHRPRKRMATAAQCAATKRRATDLG